MLVLANAARVCSCIEHQCSSARVVILLIFKRRYAIAKLCDNGGSFENYVDGEWFVRGTNFEGSIIILVSGIGSGGGPGICVKQYLQHVESDYGNAIESNQSTRSCRYCSDLASWTTATVGKFSFQANQ